MGATCGGVNMCCANAGVENSELLTVDNKVRASYLKWALTWFFL